MITPCDDLDGGEVEVVLGTSHRVAPRTTALTCRPIQGLSAKMMLFRTGRGVVETHHEHDYSGRHLLDLEVDDEASRVSIGSLGSVAPLLLKFDKSDPSP